MTYEFIDLNKYSLSIRGKICSKELIYTFFHIFTPFCTFFTQSSKCIFNFFWIISELLDLNKYSFSDKWKNLLKGFNLHFFHIFTLFCTTFTQSSKCIFNLFRWAMNSLISIKIHFLIREKNCSKDLIYTFFHILILFCTTFTQSSKFNFNFFGWYLNSLILINIHFLISEKNLFKGFNLHFFSYIYTVLYYIYSIFKVYL